MKKPSARRRRNLTFAGLLLSGCLFCVFFVSPWYASRPQNLSGSGQGSGLTDSLSPDISIRYPVINEVCASNSGFYVGNLLISSDYIELYNPGASSLSLDGLYLSDDPDAPLKSPLPTGISLEPGEFLLIYAEKDTARLPDSALSADFQLKAGETLVLSSQSGILDSVELPVLQPGASLSRRTDGSGSFLELWMSPGLSNKTAALPIEAPVLSLESGFYQEDTPLSLSAGENVRIYYTLDGSIPDETSILYDGTLILSDMISHEDAPLSARTDISSMEFPYEPPTKPVDEALILRAVAIDGEGNYSPAVTGVYFCGLQEKEGYENIPILSLVTDPEALFDENRGIYVMGSLYQEGLAAGKVSPDFVWADLMPYTNYGQRGSLYERPVHLDYFSPRRELLLSQEGGFRIRGNYSRNLPQKSFSLFSRERYGTKDFAPVFFGSNVSYSSLTLNGSYTLAKVLIGPLVSDRSIATQQYQPCQVFLNGEYWGLYDIMEKFDSTYVEHYYGMEAGNVLMIESTYEVAEGEPDDLKYFKDLRNLLEKDMSDPLLYSQVNAQMDMQSLIDWLCTNIYVANTDTKPLGGNVFTWKSIREGAAPYEDGRWRWMLYDTDNSFGAGMEISPERPAWAIDSFTDHPGYSPAGFLDSPPMTTLMANESFRRQFVLTFLDMANENFRAETVSRQINDILEQQASWNAKSAERWEPDHTYDSTAFQEEAEFIRDFFLHRFNAIVPCLAEHFSLSGELATITLSSDDPQAGSLTLNTISPSLENGSWTGQYYTDYPVTLNACPAEGYRFTGWEITGGVLEEGTGSSPSITLSLEGGGVDVKACFKKTAE